VSWKSLLQARRVSPHATSRREIADLRAIVKRDLEDASVKGLSVDRRFAIAYEGGLQLGKMAVAAAGYRATGPAHHQTTFECLVLAIGPRAAPLASYFEICRRKRNQLEYDVAGVVSVTESAEVLRKVRELQATVEEWMARNHPALA